MTHSQPLQDQDIVARLEGEQPTSAGAARSTLVDMENRNNRIIVPPYGQGSPERGRTGTRRPSGTPCARCYNPRMRASPSHP